MKNIKKTALAASLLPLMFTTPTHAVEPTSVIELPATIAIQDFSDYEFNGGWALFNDEYDLATLIENSDSRRDAKAKFVQDGELKFDARWTRKTLKLMYESQWPDPIDKTLTGQNRIDAINDRNNAIKNIRANGCDVQVEVGKASTYGVSGQRNVMELDTDGKNCSDIEDNTVGTVALRTFIPTVPGAKYRVQVTYAKRDYNWEKAGAKSEAQAYRDLILRIGSDRHQLPLEGNKVEGYRVENEEFTAERFFTKLDLRDSGYPDEYGILIDEVKVTQVTYNDREQKCTNYYNPLSKGLKNCLLSDSEPELLGCNLEAASEDGDGIKWNKGLRYSDLDYRSDVSNIFYSTDEQRFLSLGESGSVKIQVKDNGVNAACPVAGKTLSLDEVTWGNNSYETYAERGVVKAKFVGCNNAEDDGWRLLPNSGKDTARNQFVTNDKFRHDFADDDSCAITAIKIIDKTHKIKNGQSGHQANSDGIDINNLSLTDTVD